MSDPAGSARGRRFFAEARAELRPEGHVLLLDGRPARTPARAPLALPNAALGDAIAAEWRAQGDVIDPRTMPLTKLANSAIDGVAREAAAVRADILRYAGSDLVAYRASEPERLVREQAAAWDPAVAFARDDLGATFILAEGVMPVRQPETAIARVGAALERETSPFRLAGLHVMTTLSGSVLLTLMQAAGRATAAEVWHAAHVDELYQESLWGLDLEASRRREARETEFMAAARMVALAGP